MPLQSPFSPGEKHPIPARLGVAVPLSQGQSLRIVNTHGTQVVDFWCFAVEPSAAASVSGPLPASTLSLNHYLSMPHTRASTHHLTPRVHDTLTSNHRAPILTLQSDTSPGVHDTLIAACDIFRYRELAHQPIEQAPQYYHNNCADNCRNALLALSAQLGMTLAPALSRDEDWTPPAPLNLWMNIPVHPKEEGKAAMPSGSGPSCGAEVSFDRPVSKAGDEVVFRAETDVVCVMSACPQDLLEINCREPRECAFMVVG
ncbi:uncharacterized protein HMPREF1541_03949 [Cyphellophora europaea CBS 101466]|uniref:DUF1989 domain-containing protein n=1 Tax=Cyphellophora europaea (strain CBS 101466) TaxID=1220924 RepID=W2S090_CYPE1|nr:uncharacterized protein HMPREF1541_03949 [Cyphellophora europaea CBS 101466]ETN42010.1 hypothetical protein HMPREF1541_03949 [Cyphellophora europaea CBS 101466]